MRSKHLNAPKTIATLGGNARAAKLSADERRAIAKKAADERWAKVSGLPRETHTGTIEIGPISIPCGVLDDGTRVLTRLGVTHTFGARKKSANATQTDSRVLQPPSFLAAEGISQYISPELLRKLNSPLEYVRKGGQRSAGYDATILPRICETILDARNGAKLTASQKHLGLAAEMLLRGLANMGIIALVDEATGYQYDRARDELQRLLEAFVAEEMRPWVKLFPDPFFKQIYRLHGWQYRPGNTQGPRYVGKFINEYVYGRLPVAVVEELRKRNPVIDGRRRHKHFQFLTDNIGHPALDRHLASVTTLMSVAGDKDHFKVLFKTAFPASGDQTVIVEAMAPSEPATSDA